jgi:hypothetical protein
MLIPSAMMSIKWIEEEMEKLIAGNIIDGGGNK